MHRLLIVVALLIPFTSARAAAPDLPSAAHFHHVHLNVTDPTVTINYYKKYFGANAVRYRGLSEGLFTEKSFILLSKVAAPPANSLGTSLWHIGWSGVDGENEFAWRVREGIGVQTPVTPFGSNYYMYFWGPDHEIVEVWTANKNHRFEHVHLLASRLDATLRWFKENLGLGSYLPAPIPVSGVATNYVVVDNVGISVMERPSAGQSFPSWWPPEAGETFRPTDGSVIDHIAFSYKDINPVIRRMQKAGVTVVHSISKSREYGLTSFFVRGPDGLLVEVVQEPAIPDGIWQSH